MEQQNHKKTHQHQQQNNHKNQKSILPKQNFLNNLGKISLRILLRMELQNFKILLKSIKNHSCFGGLGFFPF